MKPTRKDENSYRQQPKPSYAAPGEASVTPHALVKLTTAEIELLNIFRSCSPFQQDNLAQLAKVMAERSAPLYPNVIALPLRRLG